eukprot:gene9832-biopygen4735
MGPEVGPAFQRRCRAALSFIFGVRIRTFRNYVTGGSRRPGDSGLRAAIRTAARARSGRAHETDGLWELPGSFVTDSQGSRTMSAPPTTVAHPTWRGTCPATSGPASSRDPPILICPDWREPQTTNLLVRASASLLTTAVRRRRPRGYR